MRSITDHFVRSRSPNTIHPTRSVSRILAHDHGLRQQSSSGTRRLAATS